LQYFNRLSEERKEYWLTYRGAGAMESAIRAWVQANLEESNDDALEREREQAVENLTNKLSFNETPKQETQE